jgi:hypothetical protein
VLCRQSLRGKVPNIIYQIGEQERPIVGETLRPGLGGVGCEPLQISLHGHVGKIATFVSSDPETSPAISLFTCRKGLSVILMLSDNLPHWAAKEDRPSRHDRSLAYARAS